MEAIRGSILYIDDEKDLLRLGKIFLEKSGGFNVDTAQSAREAIKILNDHQYDAIVSDYQMPGMNGISLLKEVRTLFGEIPFILFTGRGREEVVIEAINSGVDFYIQKGGDPRAQFAELAYNIERAVERHQAKKALQESEEKYRQIVETANEGIWAMDSQYRTTMVNQKMADMIGYTVDEMVGSYITDFTFPEELSDNNRKMENRQKGLDEIYERKLRHKDGSERWVQVSVTAKKDRYGNFSGSFGMLSDITERKRAQEELIRKNEELHAAYEQISASEEELRENYEKLVSSEAEAKETRRRLGDIIEFLPDATVVIDTDNRVISWNKAMEEMTGVPKGEMIGKGDYAYAVPFYGERRPILIDLVFKSDDEITSRYYSIIKKEGNVLIGETALPRPLGMSRFLLGKASVLYNETGEVTGAIESIRDITYLKSTEQELRNANEQMSAAMEKMTSMDVSLKEYIRDLKKTEIALRESEAKYRSIFENMLDLFYRTDRYGTITMISPSGAKLMGYSSPEEIIGKKNILEFYSDPAGYEQLAAELELKGRVVRYPLTLTSGSDGNPRYFTANSQYYSDSYGNIMGVEGILHDITDQKLAEDALRQANRQLGLLNSLTRHGIINKVTSLLGYLELAEENDSDQALKENLDRIKMKIHEIQDLIEDTGIYQDLGTHTPQWQKLKQVISRLNIPEEILLHVDLPDVDVYADLILEKAFFNLLDNSIRHGGHVSDIRISSFPTEAGLVIVWEDNGIGIPSDKKESIFDKGVGMNTGLGLFLVREILAVTGITIRESGVEGMGAKFEIIVPKGGYRLITPSESG